MVPTSTNAIQAKPRRLDDQCDDTSQIVFTIATLVTDTEQYAAMRASFARQGFTGPDCEFLFLDNTGTNQTCAYRGLNRALTAARGKYVILCHQDVRLVDDGRNQLETRLTELDAKDPAWALAGNAGGTAPGKLAVRITDPHGADQNVGCLPARVMSLDENFILIKREANLAFSRDLSGFHFYGADICTVADVLGWSAYVIDFHLHHLSAGNPNRDFEILKEKFRTRWSRALQPRWIQTTCALLRIDGDPLRQIFGQLAEAPYQKIARRLPGASGWTNKSLPQGTPSKNPGSDSTTGKAA
ncbi:MAG: acyl esterase [Alphaproteobacteria bacterium]|nr:acyl esterase [Alphaproteobacteria bacterium]